MRIPVDSDLWSAFNYALREVLRQDEIHAPGFPADRDGVRLGLAAMQDELTETLEAWSRDKRRGQDGWDFPSDMENELVQTIAVGLRLLRSLHAKRGPSFDV